MSKRVLNLEQYQAFQKSDGSAFYEVSVFKVGDSYLEIRRYGKARFFNDEGSQTKTLVHRIYSKAIASAQKQMDSKRHRSTDPYSVEISGSSALSVLSLLKGLAAESDLTLARTQKILGRATMELQALITGAAIPATPAASEAPDPADLFKKPKAPPEPEPVRAEDWGSW